MSKKAVIVQCRLSSTRLPGKALKLLNNKTVLEWVLTSMHKVPADRYFVATDSESYDQLKPVCQKCNFEIFQGDLNNVLKRFCDLIRSIDVDTVIRATADNPFLFYEAAIDSLQDFEEKLLNNKSCDYLTYSGLPHGCGVEIINAKSLLNAAENTDSEYDKEHVGPALYNHKDKFTCHFIPAPEKYNFPELRSTIDTYGDFLRAEKICDYCENKLGLKSTEPYSYESILNALQSEEIQNPIVYMPSVCKGHGTGHLIRCLNAAIESNGFVYIPETASLENLSEILISYKNKGLKSYQIISNLPDDSYKSVFVTDLFKINKNDISIIPENKMLISIDEGSEFHSKVDFLLDIIPGYKLNRKPNDFNKNLIVKPENKKEHKVKTFQKILVCVGGEDPSNLTEKAATLIKLILPDSEVTAISTKKLDIENVTVTGMVDNLREKLFNYDLVITHYGLTAFEALAAGCGVILLSTTKLHENLAKKYNFSFVPYKKLSEKNLRKALNSEKIFTDFMGEKEDSLGIYIQDLTEGVKLNCPVCRKKIIENDLIISRNKTRTYKKCSVCGMNYIAWTSIKDRTYEKSYFFTEYKNQYGKTYKEDFDSIKKSGILRIKNISKILKNNSKSVLDIGCAYGPFLSAAKDYGYIPYGTDISEDAVNYVRDELKMNSVTASFPEIDTNKTLGTGKFDCCTMWYVIEHFKNLDSVLRKVNEITKESGVFAFSTPSGQGVSAKSNKDHFYEISPTDHFSVWDFSSSKKVLKKYGFKVVKIVSTGHHPERFNFIKKHNINKNTFLWKLIDRYSRIFKLGDTMEIYCKKIRDVK